MNALCVAGTLALTLVSALLKRADDQYAAWADDTAGDDET